jgi:hypothetical protein
MTEIECDFMEGIQLANAGFNVRFYKYGNESLCRKMKRLIYRPTEQLSNSQILPCTSELGI